MNMTTACGTALACLCRGVGQAMSDGGTDRGRIGADNRFNNGSVF